MTDIIDIKTGKPLDRIEFDESSSMSQYLQFWKAKAKERGIESVIIMSVDEDGSVVWDVKAIDHDHLLKMQSCLKHLDDYLDALIWPDSDELEIDVDLDDDV